MKHVIALTCSALARSVYHLAADAPHAVTVTLLDQGLHNTPNILRKKLQDQIDALSETECDAILLAYGICGTSTLGLTARNVPVVMPRAHDCVALYLGSHQRYQEEFDANPGTYWYSLEYLERGNSKDGLGAAGMPNELDAVYDEYVEKYGKDNADYLMQVMGEWHKHYNRAVFISTDLGNGTPYEEQAKTLAEQRGWLFERREGNRRLLKKLVHGDWTEDEILIIQPGQTTRQVGDAHLINAFGEDS